eukprot:1157390-Pelagomonas_calceolata.AAC.2
MPAQEISAMDVQTDLQGSSSNSGCCSVAYVADKDGDLHVRVVDLRAGTAVHGKPLDLHNSILSPSRLGVCTGFTNWALIKALCPLVYNFPSTETCCYMCGIPVGNMQEDQHAALGAYRRSPAAECQHRFVGESEFLWWMLVALEWDPLHN